MKIVLTGSHGFIGARLKKTFEDIKPQFLANDPNLDSEEEITLFCVDRNETNIYEYTALGEYILNSVGPKFVLVHAGAMADPKECEANKEEAYRANVLWTQNLAHICGDFNNPMIYLSSDQVYDFFNEKEHREYNIPKPTNYYGLTKFWGENVLKDLCRTHFIFRLTWQYDIIRGDVPNKGIIYNVLNAAKEGRKIVGSQKSYRYATWVNMTILFIVEAVMGHLAFGTYNIASVTDKNIYELYRYVIEKMGLNYRDILSLDNSLKVINLTPYPYALEAFGASVTTFEDTFEKVLEELQKQKS